MRSPIHVVLAITLPLLCLPAVCLAADLTAGVATVDITPPRGYRMAGYFAERINTATHDLLLAKAVVFGQGDVRAALVICDVIGISADVAGRARALAERKTAIPAAHIAIAATHTHTGPLYWGALREFLHERAVAGNGSDPCEGVDYAAILVEKIVEAIARAQAAARPVSLDTGMTVQAPPLSFNRRFHLKDGTVQFNPGQQNPNIVRPAGPIDPDVGVLLFRDAAGRKPFASLTVFALHLDTTGGTEWSADYPYYLEKTLRATFGGDFVSIFGTGTCGDVNHIDVTIKGRRTAEEIGTLLGKTVLAAAPKLHRMDDPSLAVRRATVEVPLQQYSAERIAQARKDMAAIGTGKLPFLAGVEACKIVDLQFRKGQTLSLEVQVFRLSRDVAIVTLPGEVFVEFGLAIKKASPFGTTLVIELANDCPAYIPTKKAFAEGSYETVNSRIQPGGGELMLDAAVTLLKELGQPPRGR